jgi:hypothetical protein
VLSAEFERICPRGNRAGRAALLDALRAAHGRKAPGAFRIEVRDCRGRSPGPGFWLATYEEWQAVEGETSGRLSTALFRERAGTRNGVEWLHVHETAIRSPLSAVREGPLQAPRPDRDASSPADGGERTADSSFS